MRITDQISESDLRKPMTLAAWKHVAESLGEKFTQAAEAHNRLLERVKRLEDELTEAKAKSLTTYLGVWRANEVYPKGVFVTHRGSLWHAEQPTEAKPGTDGTWKLAVKSGERP